MVIVFKVAFERVFKPDLIYLDELWSFLSLNRNNSLLNLRDDRVHRRLFENLEGNFFEKRLDVTVFPYAQNLFLGVLYEMDKKVFH